MNNFKRIIEGKEYFTHPDKVIGPKYFKDFTITGNKNDGWVAKKDDITLTADTFGDIEKKIKEYDKESVVKESTDKKEIWTDMYDEENYGIKFTEPYKGFTILGNFYSGFRAEDNDVVLYADNENAIKSKIDSYLKTGNIFNGHKKGE